jgi:hypothetical protein
MEILSRVSPRAIEGELYEGFLKNDAALAKRYATDASFLAKNRAEADFDALSFMVDGEIPRGKEETEIVLTCDFGARLDKLLAQKLCLSRTIVQKLMEAGSICIAGETAIGIKNLRVKGSVNLTLSGDVLL